MTDMQFQMSQRILEKLDSFQYALLKFDFKKLDDIQNFPFILLDGSELPGLVRSLKTIDGISSVVATPNVGFSRLTLELSSGESAKLIVLHKIIYKAITFMNIQEVLDKRIATLDGYYSPCLEHLFEYAVLKHYLHNHALPKNLYHFFNDFHFLVKEDLVEFFNQRYETSFGRLSDFVDFEQDNRQAMLKVVKKLPANRLIQSANVRWKSFVGYLRQAKLI